jgi:hypothetical protein
VREKEIIYKNVPIQELLVIYKVFYNNIDPILRSIICHNFVVGNMLMLGDRKILMSAEGQVDMQMTRNTLAYLGIN